MAIYYLDPENGNDSTTATPLGWWRVTVTVTGGSAPSADDTMTGGTSGATAKLTVAPGSWSGSVVCYFYGKSGTFTSENVSFTNGATGTISGDLEYCAWKTITNGATAARIAPGDTIRIKKSPDPTSIGTCTWASADTPSLTIDIPDNTIKVIDNCESGWTGVTGTTVTHSATSRKEGSYLVSIVTGTVTGKVAYKTISETDFSGYKQVSFWFRANAAITSTHAYRICLCSDDTGDTIVDDLSLPYDSAGNVNGVADSWMPITINKNSALGSSIKSVAIYRTTSTNHTILLDNIIACKDATADDSLTLQSLIGLNQSGTCWYPIMSITQGSGKQVVRIDNHTNNVLGGTYTGRGYVESIGGAQTTYKRETFKTAIPTAYNTQLCVINDSGSVGNPISFIGGYNVNDNTRDGLTLYDALTGYGFLIYASAKLHVAMSYIGSCRTYIGFCAYNSSIIYFDSFYGLASVYGIYNGGDSLSFLYVTNSFCNNNSWGLYNLYGYCYGSNLVLNNNGTASGYAGLCINGPAEIYDSVAYNNLYGVRLLNAHGNLYNFVTRYNASSSILVSYFSSVAFTNSLMGDTTEISYSYSGPGQYYGTFVFSTKHDQTADNHYTFFHGGYIRSQTSVRHTSSGIAWQAYFGSSIRDSAYSVVYPICKVACNANAKVTASIWMRRTSTSVTGRLLCKGRQIAGVDSDVYSDMTASADTWEQVSIEFTPTEAGVVQLFLVTYGTGSFTGESLYFDDMSITQA